ncbi:outer membrane efflux protein [Pseudomonas putida S11]|nr:outer membrane efflux protein [Pseudomonas putida S11]
MAILTQVRVGLLRYQLARQEVEFADEKSAGRPEPAQLRAVIAKRGIG